MENRDTDKTFHGVEWKTWLEKTNKANASLLDFAKTSMNPTMQAQENKTQFQVTMINIYGRMILWLQDSMIAKDPIHFQIAATCARSMFEHLIDLKWLIMNPQSADAFVAFTFVRRFDMADKVYRESLQNLNMNPKPNKSAIALATDTKSRALRDELCRKNGWVTKSGQPRAPFHWWGENAEQRALAVDRQGRKYIAQYVTIYGQLSNQLHPGIVGLQGISPQGVLSLFMAAQSLNQDYFREATGLACQHFPMPPGIGTAFEVKFGDNASWGV